MSDGALLDLVSRGKKDAFFQQGAHRSFFGPGYQRRSPSTRDILIEHTSLPARFGHWVDIDLPRSGDMLMAVDLRIQLPTWLPPEVAVLNRDPAIRVELQANDGTWTPYGWVNGIANFLIDRWALFMDNIMLQEGYGQYNDWKPQSDSLQFHVPLINEITGTHDGTEQHIQWNATLPELNFRVPLMGCQEYKDTGLPICAFQAQKLTLRVWLKDLSELVETGFITGVPGSDFANYEVCPEPWNGRKIRVTRSAPDGITEIYEYSSTKNVYDMGHPNLYARYSVLHFDPQMRNTVRTMNHSIVFRQQIYQDFTLEDSVWSGTSPSVKIPIDVTGLHQRFIFGILPFVRTRQNKYRDLSPPVDSEWLTSLSVIVNGEERILPWDPKKFQILSQNTQLTRDVERKLYFIIFGVTPDLLPAGPINLGRVDKITLVLNLVEGIKPDPVFNTRQAFARIKGEAWNLLDIENGIARVRFNDFA
jgi:hypothetical protein